MQVAAGYNPDTVCNIGRWRSREVSEQHYVHTRAPHGFIDNVLQYGTCRYCYIHLKVNITVPTCTIFDKNDSKCF